MGYWNDVFGNATPMKEIHSEVVVIGQQSDDVVFGSGSTGTEQTYSKDGRNVFDTQRGAIMTLSAYIQGPNGTVFDPTDSGDTGDVASIADELSQYISGLRIAVVRGAHTMEQHIGEEILPLMPIRFANAEGIALWDQNNGSILQGNDKRVIAFVNQSMPFGMLCVDDVVKFQISYNYRPQPGSPLLGSRIKYLLSTVKAATALAAQNLSAQAI